MRTVRVGELWTLETPFDKLGNCIFAADLIIRNEEHEGKVKTLLFEVRA